MTFDPVTTRPRTLRLVAFGLGLVVAVLLVIRVLKSPGATDGEEGAEPPTIVPVQVAEIVRATLRGYVESWGSVSPRPASEGAPPANARVASPVSGIVAQVQCAEGQRVARGQVLFVLDSRVADVAVTRARQAAAFAESVFARQKALGPGEATSRKLYQEAEQSLAVARTELATAEPQRALLDITAPLSGTVVKVSAKPGDAVDLTSGLAEIIDLDRLVVTTGVRSGDIGKVRRGQSASITVDTAAGSPAGRPVVGAVVFIGAQIDSGTDQVTVRVSVPRGAGLRPGQYLRVRIAVDERRNRLAVPVEGVVSRDGVNLIAVVDSNRAVLRPVQLGLRDGDLVEVTGDGLQAGMTIVASGVYGLPQESRIRIVGR